ncbi:MAG TPA: diacylglycerol kinase family protein [Ktedonobacterales bacterium]|nr:diacylglycerol kinase family protein [Ktedonobacterales bacterium]
MSQPERRPSGTLARTRLPLLVLLNPAARVVVGSAATPERIAGCLQALGESFAILSPGSESAAREQAALAARSGAWRAVVAAGGDGTVHAVAQGLMDARTALNGAAAHALPSLGILPLGTMNNLAHSLGIPEDLAVACAVLARAEPRPLDVGWAGERMFLEVAGVGLEASLFPHAEALKGRLRAHPGAMRDAFRVLSDFKPMHVTLDLDGRQLEVRALQVSVCNTPRYGASFAAAPDARTDDGWLDVVIYQRFSRLDLLRHYVSIMGGRRDLWARIHGERARRVLLMPHASAWDVHVDGATIGKTPVAISVEPGALRVLAPAPAARAGVADGPGPMEALVRAATPPSAHPALAAAGRTGESLAASTEPWRHALEAPADEARAVVGVEPERHGARRAAALRVAYPLALVGATLLTVAVRRLQLLPGDAQLMRSVQRRRSPLLDRFWQLVAEPGFPRQSTPLVGAAVIFFVALRLRTEAIFIVLASGTNVLNWFIKRVVRRQRPTHDQAHIARVINEPGFPSGHVMHYLSFFGFIAAAALANLRPSRLRRGIVSACAALIALVGPSRVYLGAHWPSDVLAGYLFGGLYLGGLLEAYARVKRRISDGDSPG